MPKETEWVHQLISRIKKGVQNELPASCSIDVDDGYRLPYAYEVLEYEDDDPINPKTIKYQTDILVSEYISQSRWIPRVIVECKINAITTHDAITYSAKASTHKNVHPYIRYGILIGNRKGGNLPGRLIRHGANFDFMASWSGYEPQTHELKGLIKVLGREFRASQKLQEIFTSSRSKYRKQYQLLHRRLDLR